MVRYIDESKAVGISLKIPTNLLESMKEVEIHEHITRTGLIIKCLEGYVATGTTKFEVQLVEQIAAMNSEISRINEKMSKFEDIIQKQNDIILGQQQMLNQLVSSQTKIENK